ncbi:MAG: bifunctional 4-hydroxy-2-oxoglutarate aldolase/2-dehydro-3-deoxy-phosphogluconate aldolase [Planctomycetaceae bacterium]|jgi:2-dehydro-3-deoxyphosphogluconate aldolase/(4S)-4-hydroxy-2-oxoglutarate aldolase|nr:bifunctional 4-hydroxy-2-oxoglutarate aldolase/2-dehydro-3-deoxy-phosphogluconate aldolase [Planctomycetaceae bacterium]
MPSNRVRSGNAADTENNVLQNNVPAMPSAAALSEKLAKYRVVPVISINNAAAALPLADALLEGGLSIAEITFRTDAAADVIRLLASKRPELCVGAGTVLTADNLAAAVDAGAEFGVAPGFNPQIVQLAADKGLPFVPGTATPTEIEAAAAENCRILKFFPAGILGGAVALKAISAPYLHTGIKFMPTGGINESNFEKYLELPNVAACGGTWIAPPNDIAEGNWKMITERCKRAACP